MQAKILTAERRPPGRPRSGKFFATSSVSMEATLWGRLDALALAHGITRHAIMRLAMEAGITQLEGDQK